MLYIEFIMELTTVRIGTRELSKRTKVKQWRQGSNRDVENLLTSLIKVRNLEKVWDKILILIFKCFS